MRTIRQSLVQAMLAGAIAALCLSPAFAQELDPQEGSIWREPVTGMEFVWVSGGSLPPVTGPASRDPYFGDDPERVPYVAGFWLGKYEVTQGQWLQIMGNNPAAFPKGASHPVEQVSLPDVRAFLDKLNARGAAKFRLPGWNEWVFAARAPYRAKYAGGDRAGVLAWHKGNSGGSTHAVGGKRPNGRGLYDMSGNVSEWCGGDASDPPGHPPGDQLFAAYRGGSWDDPPQDLSSSALTLDRPDFRLNTVGFRLVRIR